MKLNLAVKAMLKIKKGLFVFVVVLFSNVYSQAKSLDVIAFGNTTSETNHSLVSNSTQTITGALNQTARQCLPLSTVGINGGDLTFIMAVDPVKRNYVTVKLWGGDESTHASDMGRLYLYVPLNGVNYSISGRHESDYTALSLDGGKDPLPGRFFYSTTMLPLWMTKGKTSLTIKIVSTGRIYGLGAGIAPSGNYQYLMDAPSRGIYKAYTHDEAMLDVSTEVNGSIPTIGKPSLAAESVLNSGGTYFTKINNRINNRLSTTVSVSNFTTEDIEYLARSFTVSGLAGYNNVAVVKKVVALIDAYTNDYYENNNSVSDGGNEGWGGRYGHIGYAIYLLKDQLQNWLDVTLWYKSSFKTRREAWGDMLVASRDYGRFNRRAITNQTCWGDQSIYCANKGLLAIGDNRAFTEPEAQRYLKEAVGISPWLGNDLPSGGSAKPWGSNYYQITNKGLSREFGYVGTNYGEMSPFAARFYRLTGNEEFKQQAIKMIKARINFRRPAIQLKGSAYYWAMEGIGLLAWRGAGECDGTYANQIAYGDRAADFGGMYCAATTLDPDVIAYAKQMLTDKQFFESLGSLSGTFIANLDVFDDYAAIKNATSSSAELPMTDGQPDFTWVDEENAIAAVKHGNDRLWISAYWQANNGINSLARFHYSTLTYDQYGVMETSPQFRNTGAYTVRSSIVDKNIQNYLPDNPIHAYSGELLPIAVSELMPNTTILGKADAYVFRFGKYLFGINMSATQSATLKMPRGFQSATELISGVTVTDTLLTIDSRTSKIVYLNSATDTLAMPTPPVMVYISNQVLPKVSLTWTDASGANTYRVKRSSIKGGPYTVIASDLSSNTFTDNNTALGYYYVVTAVNSNGESLNSTEIETSGVSNNAPVITSTLSATAQVGADFCYSIAALYNPTSFNAIGLPNNLSIDTSSGIISGIPSSSGIYNIILSATNSAGTVSSCLVLTVTAASIPTITSSATSSAYVGVPYGYKIEATNNPVSYGVAGMPSGFGINSTNGILTGNFTTTGTYTFMLSANNSAGSASKSLVITVTKPPVPEITSEVTAAALVGKSFSYYIIASYAPISYTATGLPSGLILNSTTGEISGSPAVPGKYSVSLKAVNNGGTSTTVTLTITVSNTPPSPWIDADIYPSGSSITNGYSTYLTTPESFVLNGAGSDIGQSNDSFHFLYKNMNGDGNIIARLASRTLSGSGGDKVGLLIRESTASNAKCVFLTIDYQQKKIRFPLRTSTGGGMTYPSANETTVNGNTVPIWFKIERTGNLFNGYISLDNSAWTLVGTNTVLMTNNILVGMAVCSRTTAFDVSTFDNVSSSFLNTDITTATDNDIKVSPNPVSDFLYLEFNDQSIKGNLSIYDLSGRLVFSGVINGGSEKINISSLKSGIYTLKLDTGGQVFVAKVLKR